MSQHDTQIEVSVIVPIFNEAEIIETSYQRITAALSKLTYSYEIIFVDDGSTDNTSTLIQSYAKNDNHVRLLSNGKNIGKGAALKRGIGVAEKASICFMDADLTIDPAYIEPLLTHLHTGYDAVVGTRFKNGGYAEKSLIRKIVSYTFKIIRTSLVKIDHISDTQCSIKVFRAHLLKKISQEAEINGFCYDVELLYRFQTNNYSLAEIPVYESRDIRPSRLRVLSAALDMTRDLLRLRRTRLTIKTAK